MNWTIEEQIELTQILGVGDNWGGVEIANYMKANNIPLTKSATYDFNKTFDDPLDQSKLSRKNPTVNDKYINLLKVFFAIREECHQGKLGCNKKGEPKLLQSIEKWERVFFLKFTNGSPRFLSFSKAAELANITLEDIQNITNKDSLYADYNKKITADLVQYGALFNIDKTTPIKDIEATLTFLKTLNSNTTISKLIYTLERLTKYEGIKFDINYFLDLVEECTKSDWEADLFADTFLSSKSEIGLVTDRFYQDKIMGLKEHYAFRRLFTYADEREKPTKVEYAELSPEGKSLPDWYIHFRQDTYKVLLRREQLVAYMNNYDDRYNNLDNKNFELTLPSEESIKAHKGRLR